MAGQQHIRLVESTMPKEKLAAMPAAKLPPAPHAPLRAKRKEMAAAALEFVEEQLSALDQRQALGFDNTCWSHAHFRVDYPSLSKETVVAGTYLRVMLDELLRSSSGGGGYEASMIGGLRSQIRKQVNDLVSLCSKPLSFAAAASKKKAGDKEDPKDEV